MFILNSIFVECNETWCPNGISCGKDSGWECNESKVVNFTKNANRKSETRENCILCFADCIGFYLWNWIGAEYLPKTDERWEQRERERRIETESERKEYITIPSQGHTATTLKITRIYNQIFSLFSSFIFYFSRLSFIVVPRGTCRIVDRVKIVTLDRDKQQSSTTKKTTPNNPRTSLLWIAFFGQTKSICTKNYGVENVRQIQSEKCTKAKSEPGFYMSLDSCRGDLRCTSISNVKWNGTSLHQRRDKCFGFMCCSSCAQMLHRRNESISCKNLFEFSAIRPAVSAKHLGSSERFRATATVWCQTLAERCPDPYELSIVVWNFRQKMINELWHVPARAIPPSICSVHKKARLTARCRVLCQFIDTNWLRGEKFKRFFVSHLLMQATPSSASIVSARTSARSPPRSIVGNTKHASYNQFTDYCHFLAAHRRHERHENGIASRFPWCEFSSAFFSHLILVNAMIRYSGLSWLVVIVADAVNTHMPHQDRIRILIVVALRITFPSFLLTRSSSHRVVAVCVDVV